MSLLSTPPLLALRRWRTRRCARVILYHRIVDDDTSPRLLSLMSGVMITRSAFARQLDYLTRHYQVVDLDDLVDHWDRPGNRVAITFDDGYLDNLHNALPLLQSRGLPATVFAVVEHLRDPTREFWRNRLARMIAATAPADLVLDCGSERRTFAVEKRPKQQLKAAENWLAGLPEAEREQALASQPPSDADRFLDVDAAHALRRGGVSLASHTLSHPRLADLSPAEADREISQSRQQLETLLNCPVEYFAYPYGDNDDFTEQHRESARRAGYRAAFAATRGLVTSDTDRFAIPRIGTRQAFPRFLARVSDG